MKRGLKKKRAAENEIGKVNKLAFGNIFLIFMLVLAVCAGLFAIAKITGDSKITGDAIGLLYRCTDYDNTNINNAADASYSTPSYAQVKTLLLRRVVQTKYDKIVREKLSEAYCASATSKTVSYKSNINCGGNTKVYSVNGQNAWACCTPSCAGKACGANNGCYLRNCEGTCSGGKECKSDRNNLWSCVSSTTRTTTPPCSPQTCSQLEKECGNVNNGCGLTLNCGTCTTGTCSNGVCTPANPTNAKAAQLSPSSKTVVLTWTPVTGATNYYYKRYYVVLDADDVINGEGSTGASTSSYRDTLTTTQEYGYRYELFAERKVGSVTVRSFAAQPLDGEARNLYVSV